MPYYELYDHAGEIPLQDWRLIGIQVPIFDKDGTLTSFHHDELISEVVEGLLEQRISEVFPSVALVSNSDDPDHVQDVAGIISEALKVNVFSVSKGSHEGGYPRKPNPEMGLAVARHFDILPRQLGVIGDRRLVDVRFGHNLGAGVIALCKKVGDGDARGVPTLRKLETLIVGVDRIRRHAEDIPIESSSP